MLLQVSRATVNLPGKCNAAASARICLRCDMGSCAVVPSLVVLQAGLAASARCCPLVIGTFFDIFSVPCSVMIWFMCRAAHAGRPVAVGDTFPQAPTGPTSIPGPGVLGNDTVPCNGSATIVVVTPPKAGNLTLNNNGSFVYVPSGTPQDDSFVYEIRCQGNITSRANVTLVAPPSKCVWWVSYSDDIYVWSLAGGLVHTALP